MAETFASEPMGQRVVTHAERGIDVWALPLGVPEVVSFRGSFRTGIDLAGSDRMRLRAAARLLDRGSDRLDRFEIAEWLEGRGAELQFSTNGARLDFSGRALRRDVLDVLELAAELLDTPRFDAEEVEKVKRELTAGVQRAATDTAYLSNAALRRVVYHPDHPGWTEPLDHQRERIEALDAGTIARFFDAACRARPVQLALAGDLDEVSLHRLATRFAGGTRAANRSEWQGLRAAAPGRTNLRVPDKSNVDIHLGCGVPLLRTDPRYQPLRVGVFALGGNFSARLMQEVRDRQGLTYGIRASLREITAEHEGHLEIAATFSPEHLERGIGVTAEVLDAWQREGCTDEEIRRVKETLIGTYDVGLSTTRGLASVMLSRMEEGYPPAYLDAYRDEIAAVEAVQVSEAIGRLIDSAQLHTTASGPIPQMDGSA